MQAITVLRKIIKLITDKFIAVHLHFIKNQETIIGFLFNNKLT